MKKIRKRWALRFKPEANRGSNPVIRSDKTVLAHTKSEARAFFKLLLNKRYVFGAPLTRIPQEMQVVEAA